LKHLAGEKIALAIVLFSSVLPLNGAKAASPDSLVVSYKKSPQSELQKWTLKCNPAGGTMPNAKTVCKRLLKVSKPFAPVNSDRVCAQIYESEEAATVRGSWKGKKVTAKFSKNNGCEIDRWKALEFFLQG
jgi:hypothetical protein